MNNNSSRFYHHFMPKTMPYVIVPSVKSSASSNCDDHILNLSASLSKHCPVPNSTTSEDRNFSSRGHHNNTCIKAFHSGDISPSPQSPISTSYTCAESEGSKSPKIANSSQQLASKEVDMNCNDVKNKTGEGDCGGDDHESNSVISENTRFDEDELEQMTEIDVDDSCSSTKSEDTEEETLLSSKPNNNLMKKSKSLAFGIDRILSFSRDHDKDQKSPPSPSSVAASPPVVSSNALSKSPSSADTSKFDNSKYHHHQQSHNSILSKLKLCASLPPSENQKRLPLLGGSGLPYFHHSYSPFHHHHHHHVNSLITSTSGGGIHNLNSHHHHQQHPLSHCSECVFLRRHGGGGGSSITSVGGISNARVNSNNIPSSSSSSANNVATNNMQFSSSMATPCGPTSSAISASFTWMANPSVYDSSAIISPVAGYNQHVPLQPSFGMSASGFSTLATMQQCGSGGSSGRRKRSWSRAVFSNLQRKGLEKRFQIQKYITKPDRRQLAATLGLTDAQVKVWFQNRRMKWRHSKEGKVSSGTGECTAVTPSSSPVTSTTSSKMDGAMKDKK